MSTLSELARRINEMNGTKLDHKGAKRRLDLLGASVEDLKSPAKVEHLLKMCSEPPCIWTMYDNLMLRAIKFEKDVAELKAVVTGLKEDSFNQLQSIENLNNTIENMKTEADKAADRIQQLEEECERLRNRIDQLEKGQDDYLGRNLPSYVDED